MADRIFDGSETLHIDEVQKPWLVAYIDLCAEELFDYLRGVIAPRVWNDWQKSIIDDFDRGKQLMAIFEGIKDQTPDLAYLIEKREPPQRWSRWTRFWDV